MTTDYDYELELLALSPKGRAEYRVRTEQQYSSGDIDPACRLNLQKRAVRTRISDRDIEFVFGRGGDTSYIRVETGEPDTYTEPKVEWVQATTKEGEPYGVAQTTLKTYTKLERVADGNFQAKFKTGVRYLETDELTEAMPQETSRLNFHMISKLQLNRELALLYRQGRETPTKRVPYPRAGCSPIGNLKSTDEVSWRDAEYRRAILLKRTGKHGNRSLRRRQIHDLPHGLYYNKNEGEYEVMLGRLNLHGRRIVAHNRVERKSRLAKDAYEQLMETLVDQAVRGRPENRLVAWEIMAKYGEKGLRTGSRMFQDFFEDPEASWIYPDDAARGRAFERFAYDNLFVSMRTALHAAYDDPGTVEQYNPFWTTEDHEKRYGSTWETVDPNNNHNIHRHKPWAKLITDFIEANFDRSFPSEQYQYAKMLSRLFGSHDKKSPRSIAKALQRVEALTIHVISQPTVKWIFEPDGKERWDKDGNLDPGSGEWKLHIDWSTFDYFAEGIEAVRDWVRMIGEWKFTKSARNSYDAMSFEARTADGLRGNDWGGIWNPVPYWSCWSFWLEYLYADSRPSVLDEHGMPSFDADGNRKWYRRAPMPIMPADPFNGPPKRDSSETCERWQERVVEWNAKYSDDKPVRPADPVRTVGESDEDWKKRYQTWLQAWNKTALHWQEKRDDHWLRDLESYNQAIDRRVVFMGWAWYDRDPDADMPHDGALRQLTAQKWADWLAMVTQARGFNSLLGDGLVPDMTIFIKEQSSKVRNYRNETHWMESDEGAHYDPQAFWGYMGGLLRAHVVSMINYRLQAFRESPDFLKILFKITDAKDESATTIRDQLTLMWENAPLKAITRRLKKLWLDAQEENVIHIRPLYYRFLNGLPDKVVARLGVIIRGMNRRSDFRVKIWAAQMLSGIQGGKRALGSVNKFLDEGYGTNTGNSSEVEQRAQDELGFASWMNGQYDKGIWFIRGVVIEDKRWQSLLEEREHIGKLVASGLSLDVTWEVIEVLSEHGTIMKLRDFFPTKEKFKAAHTVTAIELKYKEFIEEHIGAKPLRAVLEGVMFDEMKKRAA